jgi:hypothetical protein
MLLPLLMRRTLMSCFFALLGLILAVTIVTFLRNVSLWSFLMVSLVFLGMALTFLLGAFAGFDYALRRQEPANTTRLSGKDTPQPQRQPEILISRR